MVLRSIAAVAVALVVGGCGRVGFGETDEANESDAGGIEESGDAAAASSCTGAQLVCDGFDSDLSAWQLETSGGTLEVVGDPVFRGSGALRVTTTTAGAFARMTRTHVSVTTGTLYTRTYVYLPSSLATSGLVELTNTGDDSGVHTHLAVEDGSAVILVNDSSSTAGAPLPRDTWLCIEMKLEIDPNGGGQLAVDGLLEGSVENRDTTLASGYNAQSFGLYYTEPANGAYEVFFDEIAVGTAPIGCL